MSSGNEPMQQSTTRQEDHAEQLRLAGSYNPQYSGYLISDKQPTALIHEEYANADDEAYRVKTTNLPRDYASFRRVRGDGNCGFRAFYFGLLEGLIERESNSGGEGERELLAAQRDRFAQANGLFTRSGVDEIIWEDWVASTQRLMDRLVAAGSRDERMALLFTAFNNEDELSDDNSRELLTHLRFLISYHIKENPERYQDFIQDGTVDTYCSSLETVSAEMDEISLTAAYDLLGSAAGMGVEVLYLDRSSGDSVTRHKWEPEGKCQGTITMLFRPGHYDLAYPKGTD